MRVRDHVAISTAGAAALSPLVGRRAMSAWAASILIDADHYMWFCVSQRSLNPVAAVRYFNDAGAPAHRGTRMLHSPLALLAVLLLSTRVRAAAPVAAGMAAHVLLDVRHEARVAGARVQALRRDRNTCQACGASGEHVVAHLARQPKLLPSYRAGNFRTLCDDCHRRAHV